MKLMFKAELSWDCVVFKLKLQLCVLQGCILIGLNRLVFIAVALLLRTHMWVVG